MARIAKKIDIELVKEKYKEIGNIKDLAKYFHISNNRMIDILNKNKIVKNKIGNEIILSNKTIKNIIKDYSVYFLTMQEICEKYNIKIDKLRNILYNNGISTSRWNGHVKNSKITKISIIKKLISILDDKNINYELDFKVDKENKASIKINNLLIDFYKNKKIIDYEGYEYRSIFNNKRRLYNLKGYNFIQVFEDEYKQKPNIVISKILHILNIDKPIDKIQGRKCLIREITINESRDFLENNHIQGFVSSSVHFGAFYNDRLVAVMSFLNEGYNMWNLTRFASLNGYVCQGVGGKLFKYFIKKYDPNEIRSFADRRWTLNQNNNIYIKLNFDFEYITPPLYHYAKGDCVKRIRREQFKKKNLIKKYENLSETLSEMEMAKELGYGRIWDCGLFKYVWKKRKGE